MTLTVEHRKLTGMSEPQGELETDLKPLTDSVGEVSDSLKARTAVPGTYLPLLIVESQTELGQLPDFEVTKRLADLVVHVALRRGLGMTPRKLLAEMLEGYPISDGAWFEKVAPELRRVLRGAGIDVVKLQPLPPFVQCGNCGRNTTGDFTWRWDGDAPVEMPVCSICLSSPRPETPPRPDGEA